MSELFLNSRDYAMAISIIENMPSKTPKLRETYQQVTYLRGIQLYQGNDLAGAKSMFKKSLENPVDVKTKALSTFWMGRIAYEQNDYSTAISQLNQYLTLSKTLKELPDESSPYMANYILGYCYLKQKNYTTAQGYFQESVAGIKRNSPFITNQTVKKNILGDAILRAGDCLFKRNKYPDAIKFYNEAIDGGYAGFDYAMFQKGTIDGLRGNRTEQILAYEHLAKNYPESAYADDALFELGRVYTEINRLAEATQPLKKLVTDYRGKSVLVNRALIQLGLVSYNQGNLEVAINYYKQVFANNPTPSEANESLQALEEIYINNLGRPEEYTSFLETVPGYSVDETAKDSINFKAAEAQYENGNYERAIEAFTSYINKFPNGQSRLTASFHRANSYYELKNYSNALRDYEYVINRGPSRYYADAIEFAALISYNSEEDFTRAYNYYTLMEKNAPSAEKKFEAQLGAMRSAYRTNNSQAVYDNANKVANNSRATGEQQAQAYLYIGKISSDKKDFDKAVTAFEKVKSLVDNEYAAEARYQIAYIYYVQRRLDEALEICERANRESASYPYWVAKSVILMADIYTERNDLLSAKTILEAVLENYKGDEELLNIARAKKEQIDALLEKNSRLDTGKNNGLIEMDEGN
ncbi:MAG: tetratricopeptide repeat protein [Saprospiraceae bacterium]